MLVALYSSSKRQYSVFRTSGAAFKELDGFKEFCEGCAERAETSVLFANGREPGVQRLWQGGREPPEQALPANRARA